MEADILIKNALVVTVDATCRIIPNGFIAIKNGKIVDLGESANAYGYSAKKEIDAKGNIVMPGLVNSHTHCSMTIFRGMADDMPLHTWLNDYIFPAEATFLNATNVALGAKLAVGEMIRFGTTCFADMYYFEDEIAQVCIDAGIRCLLSEAVIDFPVPNNPTPQHSFDYTERLIAKYTGEDLVQFAVGPHSPYTCSPVWLQKARTLANKYDIPLHIHLAETQWEQQQCFEKNNCSPLQNLETIGCLDGKTIAAHCVHFDTDDIALMVKRGVSAVNNPISNLKLVSGIAPVPEMLKQGGNVALGTDGVVSNNNLDMFSEMKTAALIHKMNTNDPSVASALDMVKMATINGAKALGLDSKIGSLEVGKCADIIIIDINQAHAQPLYNIYSQLVYSLCGHDIDTVLVNGKVLMEHKQLYIPTSLSQTILEVQVLASVIKAELHSR